MHVAIVGGGVIGTALAASLSERAEVTLLERSSLGGGTTAASMAMIHRQQPVPNEYDLRLRRLVWEGYEPFLADLTHTRIGSLYVAETEAFANQLREAAPELTDFGVETEYFTGEELSAFGIEAGVGGIYTPDEGYFEPDELVEFFADCARKRGVRIETGVEVTGIDPGEQVTIETSEEEITAEKVVNAAGPWATEVDGLVGLDYPLRHTRGPILSFETDSTEPRPFTLFERGLYCRSHSQGLYVGRFATEFEGGTALDPDERRAISDGFREEVQTFASAVPVLSEARVREEWVGIRTVTPDGRPLVGETSVENYAVSTGMSGLGVTLAPAVADLLTDKLLGIDRELIEPLSPARFA